MLTSIFRANGPESQQIDPFAEWGLERSSLSHLRQLITDVRREDKTAANQISAFIADPVEIGHFVETIFQHARNGFVQFRMFIDGDRHRTWGYPWQAVSVVEKDKLIATATVLASYAAISEERVNFCPPVVTFIGPDKGTKQDICEGVAIMVECDDRPEASRRSLEEIFGAPTLVVKSGGIWTDPQTGLIEDKAHLYWRLSTPTRDQIEHDRLTEAREIASRIVASDPTAKPPVHPLRWPGSWHKKATPRVARIAEFNPDREVELDDALIKLRTAATTTGITLREDKPKPTVPLTDLSRDSDVWDVERDSGRILDDYRSKSSRRHYWLSCVAVRIAMSAINRGYDITADDLYGIVRQLHDQNPPTSRYSDRELRHLADDALPKAISNVGDRPAYKVKAEADAYWAEEWARITREIKEDDDTTEYCEDL